LHAWYSCYKDSNIERDRAGQKKIDRKKKETKKGRSKETDREDGDRILPPKRWYVSTKTQVVVTQKTVIFKEERDQARKKQSQNGQRN
jgi:hypothetical protein